MDLNEIEAKLHNKEYLKTLSGEDLKNILIELNAILRNITVEEGRTFSTKWTIF